MPHIYNIIALIEVSCEVRFIASVTNEWNKLPTVLMREYVTTKLWHAA